MATGAAVESSRARSLRPAAGSLLLVALLLAALSGSVSAGSRVTVSKTVYGEVDWMDAGHLEIFRLSSTPDADDGALVLSWTLDRNTWFPTWKS